MLTTRTIPGVRLESREPIRHDRERSRAGLLHFVALSLLAMAGPLHAATREAEWKKVDEASQRGLPQSAIDALEPIINGALKDRAYGEAVDAGGRKGGYSRGDGQPSEMRATRESN